MFVDFGAEGKGRNYVILVRELLSASSSSAVIYFSPACNIYSNILSVLMNTRHRHSVWNDVASLTQHRPALKCSMRFFSTFLLRRYFLSGAIRRNELVVLGNETTSRLMREAGTEDGPGAGRMETKVQLSSARRMPV